MQAGSRCLKAQGLTDVEAKQLAKELATDRSLLVLDLSDNAITAVGAKALEQAIRFENSTLTSLNWAGNPCVTDCPDVLANIERLLKRNATLSLKNAPRAARAIRTSQQQLQQRPSTSSAASNTSVPAPSTHSTSSKPTASAAPVPSPSTHSTGSVQNTAAPQLPLKQASSVPAPSPSTHSTGSTHPPPQPAASISQSSMPALHTQPQTPSSAHPASAMEQHTPSGHTQLDQTSEIDQHVPASTQQEQHTHTERAASAHLDQRLMQLEQASQQASVMMLQLQQELGVLSGSKGEKSVQQELSSKAESAAKEGVPAAVTAGPSESEHMEAASEAEMDDTEQRLQRLEDAAADALSGLLEVRQLVASSSHRQLDYMLEVTEHLEAAAAERAALQERLEQEATFYKALEGRLAALESQHQPKGDVQKQAAVPTPVAGAKSDTTVPPITVPKKTPHAPLRLSNLSTLCSPVTFPNPQDGQCSPSGVGSVNGFLHSPSCSSQSVSSSALQEQPAPPRSSLVWYGNLFFSGLDKASIDTTRSCSSPCFRAITPISKDGTRPADSNSSTPAVTAAPQHPSPLGSIIAEAEPSEVHSEGQSALQHPPPPYLGSLNTEAHSEDCQLSSPLASPKDICRHASPTKASSDLSLQTGAFAAYAESCPDQDALHREASSGFERGHSECRQEEEERDDDVLDQRLDQLPPATTASPQKKGIAQAASDTAKFAAKQQSKRKQWGVPVEVPP